MNGQEYRLAYEPETGQYRWQGDGLELVFDRDSRLQAWSGLEEVEEATISNEPFLVFRALLDGLRQDPHQYATLFLMHR